MSQETNKHEGAASQKDVASSPDNEQSVLRRRAPLLVAMACIIALAAGLGLWATQIGKNSPALTTVAVEESSASGSGAQTTTQTKAQDEEQDQKQDSSSAASPATSAAAAPSAASAPAQQDATSPATAAPAAQEQTSQETLTPEPVVETVQEYVTTEPEVVTEVVTQTQIPIEPEPEPTSLIVSVTVDGSAAGAGAYSTTLEVAVGASVYDALVASGSNVNARSTVYGAYVAAIDGLAELEHGPMSGWVYAVNGIQPQTACSNYQLKDGDAVVWTYVNVE